MTIGARLSAWSAAARRSTRAKQGSRNGCGPSSVPSRTGRRTFPIHWHTVANCRRRWPRPHCIWQHRSRSFRAERLSHFVGQVIEGDAAAARQISAELKDFTLLITRDLGVARTWLRSKRRGSERMGLLASSNAVRLKPHGVFVKAKIEPAKWFIAPGDDVRSSDALEDAATEFDVQGLELNWACVCWVSHELRN